MAAKTPAGWNNRPICQTPADLLAWLDSEADRHLAILRADQCRVTSDGANTGEPVTSITVAPATLQQEQRIFASDILKAHDWLDANPAPGIPPRPVGLECRADGSLEMTEAIVAEFSKLRRAIGASAPQGVVSSPVRPKEYLQNWTLILNALKKRDTTQDREHVRYLNKKFDGPIVIAGQGSQPKVERCKLLEWWDRLEVVFQDQANQQAGRKASAESQYSYGSTGSVAPEIGGGVKRRRSDRKA